MKGYSRRDAIDMAVKFGIGAALMAVIPRMAVASGSLRLSVVDFGAKGDGVNDDSFAFQKAFLKANEAGGGTVYFPPLKRNTCLSFPSSSLTILKLTAMERIRALFSRILFSVRDAEVSL